MKKLFNLLKTEFYLSFGYVVISPEYKGIHYTLSWKQAVEWYQCYEHLDRNLYIIG